MEYEAGSADALTYRYVYGHDRLSVNVSPVSGGAGDLIENGEIRLYYHLDRLGSARYLTSGKTGKISSWTAYDEWGRITHSGVLKCGLRQLDLVKRYTNHDFDAVLGVYYAKARFYDPSDKRFLAADPVKGVAEEPMTFNQYIYCINNPLRWIDPDGQKFTMVVHGREYTIKKYILKNDNIYISVNELAKIFDNDMSVGQFSNNDPNVKAKMFIQGAVRYYNSSYFDVLGCFDGSRDGVPFFDGSPSFKDGKTTDDVYWRLDNALKAFGHYDYDTTYTDANGNMMPLVLGLAGGISIINPAPGPEDVLAAAVLIGGTIIVGGIAIYQIFNPNITIRIPSFTRTASNITIPSPLSVAMPKAFNEALAKADTKTNPKESYRYFSAEIINDDIVPIKAMTLEQAVAHIKSTFGIMPHEDNQGVMAMTRADAINLVKALGGGDYDGNHGKGQAGYYKHYHPHVKYNAHIWFFVD